MPLSQSSSRRPIADRKRDDPGLEIVTILVAWEIWVRLRKPDSPTVRGPARSLALTKGVRD